MKYLQEINLELNSNTAYVTVGAKQGDSQSRVIKIHITENGQDWQIEPGVTASYRIRKPDGYAVWNDAVIDNTENVVYITLTSQALAAAGRAYADVLLMQGTDENKQVISTVSFIIIIMASPDIAGNITSSNEFSRILDITDNADVVLNEAEAWAVGTKAGVPVVVDAFSSAVVGGTFQCDVDESIFRQYVGESPGYTRYFIFICTGIPEGETDNHWNVNYGDTTLTDINLNDYGITITGTPLQSNTIRVVVTDSDLQYQNNAKYYAEQAASHEGKIANLTVSAESSFNPGVVKEEHEQQDGYNLHFYLPKGDTGDVNLMTFYVDTDVNSDTYGCIISCKPESMAVASIESYPEQLILKFDKVAFQQQVKNNYHTYNFIYNANGSFWHLGNNTSINLSDYGISYALNGYRLQNNDTITIKYYEQVKFSINDNGELEVEIMEG